MIRLSGDLRGAEATRKKKKKKEKEGVTVVETVDLESPNVSLVI